MKVSSKFSQFFYCGKFGGSNIISLYYLLNLPFVSNFTNLIQPLQTSTLGFSSASPIASISILVLNYEVALSLSLQLQTTKSTRIRSSKPIYFSLSICLLESKVQNLLPISKPISADFSLATSLALSITGAKAFLWQQRHSQRLFLLNLASKSIGQIQVNHRDFCLKLGLDHPVSYYWNVIEKVYLLQGEKLFGMSSVVKRYFKSNGQELLKLKSKLKMKLEKRKFEDGVVVVLSEFPWPM
ncbi:uncharacterized protein LOC132299874 [Cornus florida]|uniref:uncharacterized protein LOC132299874 n=1 Tax=Cornus florida TaxID=4283 RepID=UPI00289EA88E|nr:uncharacterized protein LOC132299874 [Cornus florida]